MPHPTTDFDRERKRYPMKNPMAAEAYNEKCCNTRWEIRTTWGSGAPRHSGNVSAQKMPNAPSIVVERLLCSYIVTHFLQYG